MKKVIVIALSLFALSGVAYAAPLTPGQALKRAGVNSIANRMASKTGGNKLAHTFETNGSPTVYAFSSGEGYILLSADDVAAPVLGYSDSGSFNVNELPPQMVWWIEQYSKQIATAAAREGTVNQEFLFSTVGTAQSDVAGRKIIAPLMTTKWNQDAPYNLLVPGSSASNHYPTGCVATAMAQVMKRWQYPSKGEGYGYITLPAGTTGDAAMDLSVTYDWGNMLNEYIRNQYSETQANAVATLMKACGYASKMTYAAGGSGALARFSAEALVKNFGYNANLRYCEREYYSNSQWEEMVYAELEAGRPVMYGGQSSSVGHEFVCDGYAGNGYFHFNWGWGGMSDGYFLLAALDPSSVGIGGGTGNDGYNSNQDIVIGVQPEATGKLVQRITQLGTLTATANGGKVTLALKYNNQTGLWTNTDFRELNVNLGIRISRQDGTASGDEFISISDGIKTVKSPAFTPVDGGYSVEYSGYRGSYSFDFPSSLSDGTYKCTIGTFAKDETVKDFQPVLSVGGCNDSFYIIKENNAISLTMSLPVPVSVTDLRLGGRLYYGNATTVVFKTANNSTAVVETTVKPCLYQGETLAMEADAVDVSLAGGEQKEFTIPATFRLAAGQKAPTGTSAYVLRLADAETNALYDAMASVKMSVTGGTNFVVESVSIEGHTTNGETIGGGDSSNVYELNSSESVKLNVSVKNNGIYFGYGIAAQLFKDTDLDNPAATSVMSPTLMLTTGATGVTSATLDLSQLENASTYVVKLYALTPNGFSEIKNAPLIYIRITGSAVEEISVEATVLSFDKASNAVSGKGVCSLEVYDIQGRKLTSAYSDTDTDLRVVLPDTRSVLIAVARSRSGKTATSTFTI